MTGRLSEVTSRRRQKMFGLAPIACTCVMILTPARAPVGNVVIDWATIVQPAIHNAVAPRPVPLAEILHTTVQLAMYDAAVAIEGGYEPYAAAIPAPPDADVRVAVATAAYVTARARVFPSQVAYLDAEYLAYMNGIPDGQPKDDGVLVGEQAAAAVLARRAGDGFSTVVLHQCSAIPAPAGEFVPNGGCGTQPVGTNVGQIRPFTDIDPVVFAPNGPPALTSQAYADAFIETRDYGRTNSLFRTAEQTDILYFWSEHSYVHWNRNLNSLAVSRQLSVLEAARFLAMVHTASSDALITGFNAKYAYRFWRPRTAIPRADEDGNPATEADLSWTPELTVNHPEYPSAHGFWSTALTDTVARFFGTNRIDWTIETPQSSVPQVVQTLRTYHTVNDLMREIDDARVWAGLHWRFSVREGGQIGQEVARHVARHHFRSTK